MSRLFVIWARSFFPPRCENNLTILDEKLTEWQGYTVEFFLYASFRGHEGNICLRWLLYITSFGIQPSDDLFGRETQFLSKRSYFLTIWDYWAHSWPLSSSSTEETTKSKHTLFLKNLDIRRKKKDFAFFITVQGTNQYNKKIRFFL